MSEQTEKKRTWSALLVVLVVAVVLLGLGELAVYWGKHKGWKTYFPTNSGGSYQVGNLTIDHQGRAWMGKGGLSMLDTDGGWMTYTPANSGLIRGIVGPLAVDSQGRVWVGYGLRGEGLSVLDLGGNWTTYPLADGDLPEGYVTALAVDRQDRVWVGIGSSGLGIHDTHGDWTVYTSANSDLPDGSVSALAVDSQGRVWLGTAKGRSGRLSMFDPKGDRWESYPSAWSALSANRVSSLATDSQDRVWVGTWGGGVSMLGPDGNWTNYTPINSGLASKWVGGVVVDGQNRVWVGTNDGLSMIDSTGSWTTYTEANSGLVDDDVTALTLDGQDRVWAVAGWLADGLVARLEGSGGLNRLDVGETFSTQTVGTLVILRTVTRLAFGLLTIGAITWFVVARTKAIPKQKLIRISWEVLGVVGGFALGGFLVFVVSFYAIVALNPCSGSECGWAALGAFYSGIYFGVIGPLVGAIIGRNMVTKRLQQPHKEAQSIAADAHHSPDGDEVEE